MKYRISLIALSALLAFSACKAEPERHYVKNDKDQEEEVIPEGNGKTLLAGSFNIRYFNTTDTYPWSVRKDAVFKFIETTSPDFLGLQEVKATQSQDFAYKLSGTYGYYDIDRDTGKGISSGSGEGIGILYKKGRFELKDKGFSGLQIRRTSFLKRMKTAHILHGTAQNAGSWYGRKLRTSFITIRLSGSSPLISTTSAWKPGRNQVH